MNHKKNSIWKSSFTCAFLHFSSKMSLASSDRIKIALSFLLERALLQRIFNMIQTRWRSPVLRSNQRVLYKNQMENMPVVINKDFPSRIICAIIPHKFRVQAIGYKMSFFISRNTIFFTIKLKLRPKIIKFHTVWTIHHRNYIM